MNLQRRTHAQASTHATPNARYVSSNDLQRVLDLLCELRDETLSRVSYQRATKLIVDLGGADRLRIHAVVDGE